MTEAIDRPALDEVEIALAAVVPQPGAFAAHEYGRRARRDLHQRVKRMYGIGHVDLLLRGVKRPAETQEGRTFPGAAFSKTLLINYSALSSDMAQPVIVADATTESCAAVGPVQVHAAGPYS